jgi:hypothetical protein
MRFIVISYCSKVNVEFVSIVKIISIHFIPFLK